MRILHVIIDLDVGGAELMLKRLVLALDGRAGHRHTVISLTGIGRVGRDLEQLGVEVISLGMRSPLAVPRVVWELTRLIRRLAPDVVQTWMYHSDLLGGLAGRLAGRPVVWNVRGTEIPQGPLSPTAMVIRACARLSASVPAAIVCCAESARVHHAGLGYCERKLLVVPNGYELRGLRRSTAIRAETRRVLGVDDGTLLVGAVGRFDPLKDYENLIRAAAMVAARHARTRFVLVGRDCEEGNATLRRWLSSAGLQERFLLLGERSDVPRLLSALDVFCLSSRAEGFPNVVCEAMAMELPCVVTRAGDAGLIVGDAGLVVPVRDPQALADALSSVCAMAPGERAALGRAGRDRVEQQFDISVIAPRYATLYDRLAGADKRAA